VELLVILTSSVMLNAVKHLLSQTKADFLVAGPTKRFFALLGLTEA
jgi:hypothetical protein